MEDKSVVSISALVERRHRRLNEEATKRTIEANAISILAKRWPADKPLQDLYHNESRRGKPSELGEFWLSAKVNTREEAVAYLNGFALEPLGYYKGTFTTIRPIAWLPENFDERYDTVQSDILPTYWTFDDFTGAMLKAYVTLDGLRCSIKVSIKNDPSRRKVWRGLADANREDIRITKWELPSAPGGQHIIYASGSASSAGHVCIYFSAEQGGAAPKLHDFMCGEHFWQTVRWQSNR